MIQFNIKKINTKNVIVLNEINEILEMQISLYKELITDVEPGTDVIKNLDTNTLEHIVKGLIPVISIDEKRFLFGT